jgi:hypothetical protein
MSAQNRTWLQERNRSTPGFMSVATPQAHEGVGRALRSVFERPKDDLPTELMALLDRLDFD